MNADALRAIHCQGGLLTEGLLDRMRGLIEGQDIGLPLDRLRLRPEDYDLSAGETLREQALRAWQRLLRAWASLKEARAQAEELALAITQQRWLRPLFEELGFGPPQPLSSGGFIIGGRRYPISHLYGEHVPLHLLPWDTALDRRTRALKGAARSTPHSMVQELLNRSEAHLWGILCNGATLRLLRDNDSLTQLAYIEFDLQRIFEDERWPDFFTLWLTCHRSRFEPIAPSTRPDSCVLERWMEQSRSEGVLALDALRKSVIDALTGLSRGFERATPGLRAELGADKLHEQLLRVVYRLMFLCVTEERDALLLPRIDSQGDAGADDSAKRATARERYERHYSLRALRRDAAGGKAAQDNPHNDLWLRLLAIADGLSRGHERLALPAINSFLWSNAEALPDLKGAACRNDELLKAVWSLDHFTHEDKRGKRTERINWRDISAAELGSVYEALLELHPRWSEESEGLDYDDDIAGSTRKETGSYYTPVELVEALLDAALDPLLARAVALPREEREAALLALKICDPSCGSGHFLVAAARRIGHELASTRSGEEAPSPELMRVAIRDVVAHCLYGVDLNRMAVELCKVALWMEAMVPGLPLPYLEHHIQHGNALFGATPELLARPLPEDAIAALDGDDGKVTNTIRATHRKQVAGQLPLSQWARGMIEALTTQAGAVEALGDDTLLQIDDKDKAWKTYLGSAEYARACRHADLWCAAFVWRRTVTSLPSPTHDTLLQDPLTLPNAMYKEVKRLRERYRFFHWHLQFPQVFRVGDDGAARGGFDLVLGNPPWERVKLEQIQWFSQRAPHIAQARNKAERDKLVAALPDEDPALYEDFLYDLRKASGESHFARKSGRYPLCGVGDVNTYALFSEHNRAIIAPTGRAAFIVPSGIVTLDTYKNFFADLMREKQLASAGSFTEIRAFFPGTDSREPFSIISISEEENAHTEFVFGAENKEDLYNPQKRFTMSFEDIAAINPNTLTCPIFRSNKDAEITKKIHKYIPIFMREGEYAANPWEAKLGTMFHMSGDSHLFWYEERLTEAGWSLDGNIWRKDGLRARPLWEAKMIHHFDHRFGTYEGQTEAQARQGTLPRPTPEQKADPSFVTLPRYWVEEREIHSAMPEGYEREWLIAWRDIVRSTDERTAIFSLLPLGAVGHTSPLLFSDQPPIKIAALLGNLNSLVCDYALRQRLGGTHLTYGYLKQTPVLPPHIYDEPCPWARNVTLGQWIASRVLGLVYNSYDMEPFARDCGYKGEPFAWSEDKRSKLRAELDAAFFGMYGLTGSEVKHVLSTFNLVDKDQKDLIEQAYTNLLEQRNKVDKPTLVAPQTKPTAAVAAPAAEIDWKVLIATGVLIGVGIAMVVDALEDHKQRQQSFLTSALNRIKEQGFAARAIQGMRATWQLGGWVVEVDFTGPEKARAKALHAEQEEERGRAFVLSAPDLAEQVATFLRGLNA